MLQRHTWTWMSWCMWCVYSLGQKSNSLHKHDGIMHLGPITCDLKTESKWFFSAVVVAAPALRVFFLCRISNSIAANFFHSFTTLSVKFTWPIYLFSSPLLFLLLSSSSFSFVKKGSSQYACFVTIENSLALFEV